MCEPGPLAIGRCVENHCLLGRKWSARPFACTGMGFGSPSQALTELIQPLPNPDPVILVQSAQLVGDFFGNIVSMHGAVPEELANRDVVDSCQLKQPR